MQAELPPVQVEPVDLSVKIKVEPLQKQENNLTVEHTQHAECDIVNPNVEALHVPNISHLPINLHISKTHTKYETNNNNHKEHPIDKGEVNTSSMQCIKPPISLPITTLNSILPLNSISSQSTNSTSDIKNQPYVRHQPPAKINNNHSTTEPNTKTVHSVCSTATTINVPVTTATTSTTISKIPENLKSSSEFSSVNIKTEPPFSMHYSGSLLTAPTVSASLDLSKNSVLLKAPPSEVDIKANFSKACASIVPGISDMIPPSLSDSLIISPIPPPPLTTGLAIPTSHLTQEALAKFMKEHQAHPHFPIPMAHFAGSLPIPLQLEHKTKSGGLCSEVCTKLF